MITSTSKIEDKPFYYAITYEDVKRLQAVAKRLYNDMQRMNADEMRNTAQALDLILMHLEPINDGDLK